MFIFHCALCALELFPRDSCFIQEGIETPGATRRNLPFTPPVIDFLSRSPKESEGVKLCK
jgi:hypothetical protein